MIAVLLAAAGATAVPATPAPFRCGAVERPGVAEPSGDGGWRGVAVDLCRQAAAADRGTGAVAFRAYARIEDLRDARYDNLAVLSSAELAIAQPLAPAPTEPPVAISRQLLLVRPGSALHSQADLANHRVCFIVATSAESAVNAWSRATRIAIQRVGFQEAVELRDGFDSGYCAAMAVDALDIPGGVAHTTQLGSALVEVPLFAIRPEQTGQ